MKIRISTALLWSTLLLTGLFAILNWEWFSRLEQVSVGVAEVWLPVGLLLLGVIGGLTAVFLASQLVAGKYESCASA